MSNKLAAHRLRWFPILCLLLAAAAVGQPLRSWNDGPAKQAIFKFVNDATTPGMATFVAPEDRIAVFDNDGTLWGTGSWSA